MKQLIAIIKTLTQEERKEFLQYINKKNRRGDTKNTTLFKLLCAGKTQNLDVILYGTPSKNALHALNNRLQNSLIDFIATKSFARETNEELEILKLLLAARIFFEHKQIKTAQRTLDRAENKAKELNLYAILTEIYHTKIQYAHLNTSMPLHKIIAVSKKNLSLFAQEQQLNMVYATIKEQLRLHPTKNIDQIITAAFGSFNLILNDGLSFKSLYQLFKISATAAQLQSNYYSAMPFLLKLYNIVKAKEDQAEKHLYYHLEILNILAIATFRNKNFEACFNFVLKMETEMEKQQAKYKQRFAEKLALNKSLLYNYTNKPDTAIAILKNYKSPSLDIQLTLAMCYFQQEAFKKAYAIFKQFNHSDMWYEKKAGWIWVVKKNIIEILLLIELDKLDLVFVRLQSFKNKHTNRLKKMGENRVLYFIKLVSKYYEMPSEVGSNNFKNTVENSFDWVGTEKEDVFVMSFYAWLKSKIENTNLYTTTLDLVHTKT